MKKLAGIFTVFAVLMAMAVMWGGTASATSSGNGPRADRSGSHEFGDVELGTNITECPQAGIDDRSLRRTERDEVERLSERGDDIRLNQDYTCLPQDEMSIAINPLETRNVFGGANDYRLGWGSSGFYTTTNRGDNWHDGITAFPTPGVTSFDDHIDGGGDPIAIFDREGTAYYGQIRFERENDSNGLFFNRSTNGAFTWSRPCVAIPGPPPDPNVGARCGGNGDPRQPGDGVVNYFPDNDGMLNGSVPFEDKPYATAGPRPAGVSPVCYGPVNRTPVTCPPGHVGPDRIYMTWSRFDTSGCADPPVAPCEVRIWESHSDDRARSWSPPQPISGTAAFCVGIGPLGPNACDDNQGSQPVVNPTNGHVYVAWENFNTPDENQYLLVRSTDGGATWQGPFFITPVFDVNYPRAGAAGGRPDCTARGQQGGRAVLTNSCARVNARGALSVDKRGGAFADDLYLVIADNRNGTRVSSNTDVLSFKSTNGGTIWTGPTRVNNDPSSTPALRDCGRPGRPACPEGVHTGNDQFFPWLDIHTSGWLQSAWQDRRLDQNSTAHEWPTSRQRPGNYLHWFWGGRCRVTQTGPVDQGSGRQCVHPGAAIITQPTAPVNPPDTYLDPPQNTFPWRNFGISDVPYNWDYCFRAGIFCGDYENVTIGSDGRVWAMWTDARNGRSSRMQTGRNPACEQSDAWADTYQDHQDAHGQDRARSSDSLFLVTPCPIDD